MRSFLDELRSSLAPAGLNLFGVVSRERYDAAAPEPLCAARLHPPAGAVVVVGSGGRAHWDAFLRYLEVDPVTRLARRRHPFDAFAAETFASLGPLLVDCRVIYPTFEEKVRLDFMRLAALAGLGRPSELGILVGERFGPWFGLRAALFVPHALSDGAPGPRLCDGCEKPCLVPADPRARREACVVAPEARYDELEMVYHYDRRRGRALLCARFGVTDEAGV